LSLKPRVYTNEDGTTVRVACGLYRSRLQAGKAYAHDSMAAAVSRCVATLCF